MARKEKHKKLFVVTFVGFSKAYDDDLLVVPRDKWLICSFEAHWVRRHVYY